MVRSLWVCSVAAALVLPARAEKAPPRKKAPIRHASLLLRSASLRPRMGSASRQPIRTRHCQSGTTSTKFVSAL